MWCGVWALLTTGSCRSEPIAHLLDNFIPQTKFEPLLTRAFHPPKPDPAGILHIAKAWGIPETQRGKSLIMVGDSKDDLAAGYGAGALTILLVNGENEHLAESEHTDVFVSRRVSIRVLVLESR